MKFMKKLLFTLMLLSALLAACGAAPSQDHLSVVATTSIIADVAAQVAGDFIAVDSLLPIGADPHGFDPTPQDIVKVAEADLVLANGAGLEEFLQPLIESAEADERVVTLTEGTDFIEVGEDTHDDEADEDHELGSVDPHTWTDPNNVLIWVDHLEREFSKLDPAHAAAYAENAEAYRTELRNLDAWTREQVEKIPESQRMIVTDHTTFAYFARQYGFKQAGTIIPGYSTLSEPTAQELATLEDAIDSLDVPAVFVGNTVNPSLAQRVADDTGTQLVYIYTGSLSEPGGESDDPTAGEAGSYLDYIRYNVSAIVNALAGE
jgi:ABC-type Zn uptake system ZnuABC Zn-binding protein ZnuA